MSRLLVVGCSHAEIPLILAAKRLGHWVATVGNDPSGLGIGESDHHFPIDFSDASAVTEVFNQGKFDAAVPGCNDFAAFTVAALAQRRSFSGFDDIETTRKIHHKDAFRRESERLGLRAPQFRVATSLNEGLRSAEGCRFPVIVKPIDMTGGKGVAVATSNSELRNAITTAISRSRSKKIVIEEYWEGALRSTLFMVVRGQAQPIVSADEFMYNNPFLVASAVSRTYEPSGLDDEIQAQIQTFVDGLELVDGLLHVQYIRTRDRFIILEVCRRPPGDLYLMLAESASGYDVSEALVRLACGEELEPPVLARNSSEVFRLCLMTNRCGTVQHWDIAPSLGSRISYRLDLRPRHTVISDYLTQKLGIVIGFGQSHRELVDLVCSHESHLEIKFE